VPNFRSRAIVGTAAGTTVVAAPRSWLRLMFDRTFGALLWGKMFAVVGVWTHSLVAAVVVHDATHSALAVGMVGVVQFGPQLLLSPTSGKWADKGNAARQILLGRLLCVLGSGSIAVWLVCRPTSTAHQSVLAVLAGSLLVVIGFVVGGPAMQSIVPSLIRQGELPTAMALNTAPMTVGRMIGPAAGAVLITQLGPPAAFCTSAALNLVFVACLLIMRFPASRKHKANKDYRVRAAWRYVMQDRPLRLALLAVGVVGFASDPSITLAPSMADAVGGTTRLVGELSAAFGLGAAVALAILATQRNRVGSAWTSCIGFWLLAGGSGILAVSRYPWMAVVGFAVAGLGFGCAMTGLSTVVQERAPDDLRGRIMALWMVGFVGSRPLAATVLGGSSDLLTVRAAFVISTVVAVGMALCSRPSTFASAIPARRDETVAQLTR
jgi:MFS family permease